MCGADNQPRVGATYWQISSDILERQSRKGWGAKVIELTAHDVRMTFPDMKGFSRANLMYMRAFAEAWMDAEIVPQAVGKLPWGQADKLAAISWYMLLWASNKSDESDEIG